MSKARLNNLENIIDHAVVCILATAFQVALRVASKWLQPSF